MPTCCSFPRRCPRRIRTRCRSRSRRGTPIVASALGAFTERLAGRARVRLLPWNAPASAMERRAARRRARGASSALPMREAARRPRSRARWNRDRYARALPRAASRRQAAPRLAAIEELALLPRHFDPPSAAQQRRRCRCASSTSPARCAATPRRATSSAAASSSPIASMRELETLRSYAHGRSAPGCVDLIEAQRDLAALRDEHARHSKRELARGASAHARARDVDDVAHDRAVARRRPSAEARPRGGRCTECARCASCRAMPGLALTILRNDGAAALARRVVRKLRRAPVASGRAPPRTWRAETQIAPLAVATSATPAVSIIVPAYGEPLLTFTCLASIARETSGRVRSDRRRRRVAANRSPTRLRGVTGVRFERNAGEPRLHRHVQSRRDARARRHARVPQQRYDRHRRAGSTRCSPCSTRIRTRASSARSSCIRMAGCRRRAASCGATAARGTSAATTIPTGPNSTTCAKSITAPARASPFRARVWESSADSTSRYRAGVLRGHRSRVRRARRGPQGVLPAARDDRAFRRPDVGHRHLAGRQAAPGDQPGDVRGEMARRARRASAERRARRVRARPLGEAGGCWSSTRAC